MTLQAIKMYQRKQEKTCQIWKITLVKKKKEKQGITLLVLVVTISVLLILDRNSLQLIGESSRIISIGFLKNVRKTYVTRECMKSTGRRRLDLWKLWKYGNSNNGLYVWNLSARRLGKVDEENLYLDKIQSGVMQNFAKKNELATEADVSVIILSITVSGARRSTCDLIIEVFMVVCLGDLLNHVVNSSCIK